MKIPSFLRPVASKIIAAGIGMAATMLGGKLGLPFLADPEVQRQITEVVGGWLFLTLTHTAVSVKTNPTNSASPSLSETKPAAVIPMSEVPANAPHIKPDEI